MGKRGSLHWLFLAGVLTLSACGGSTGGSIDGTGRSAAEPTEGEVTPTAADTATPTLTLTEVPLQSTATPTPLPQTPTATLDLCGIFEDACVTPTPNRCQALAASMRGARLVFAPSLPSDFCGAASNYVQPSDQLAEDATEELHVIGVYEGAGANHGPFSDVHIAGIIDVVVQPRPKPVVLALMSYEPVRWRITLAPGAVVSRVFTQGYYEQEVEGVPEAIVITAPPNMTCDFAYGWEVHHNIGGGSFTLAIADIRDRTGLIETSFQGCYVGDHFDIPHWDGEPPARPTPLALDETIPRVDMTFPGCDSITQEAQYCVTTTFSGIALVGLESGSVCSIAASGDIGGFLDAVSLSWRGQAMYVCGRGVGLLRISLIDGRVEPAQVPCGMVTDYGEAIVLGSGPFGFELTVYPSYAAVLTGAPSASYDFGGTSGATMHGDRLYTAWHSTNTINVFDLAANVALPPVTLEGYDGWILGMAVTDAGELIIIGDTWGDTIYVFDVATGAKLRELRPTEPIVGLSCVTTR